MMLNERGRQTSIGNYAESLAVGETCKAMYSDLLRLKLREHLTALGAQQWGP